MASFLLLKFNTLNEALPYFREAKALFSCDCSCMNRNDTNRTMVAFIIYIDPSNRDKVNNFLETITIDFNYVLINI